MKKSVKVCVGLLALAISLTAGIPGQASAADDPVLFTFNGQDIPQSEIVRRTEAYAQAQLISSATAYDEAIQYMIVNELVPEAKASELGLDQYTDAELAAIDAEAADYFEKQLDAYAESLGTKLSDDEKRAFREELRASWSEDGTTVEAAQETHRFNKTKARLLETMTVEISEDEIQQVYLQQVQKDEDYFSDNILAYEYFTEYQGSDIWYVPEGYRSVLRILLNVDSSLTDAYQAAVKANEGVEDAAQAIIASKQDELDAIYARLDAGEAFVDVMKDVCAPGSYDEDILESGYAVHKLSTVWGDELTAAAFSDQMQKPGDVSAPAASKDGAFILYYLNDIPSGPVEMNDRIRQSITDYLTNQKRIAMLADWADDYEITYNQEAIDALMATPINANAD